MADNADDGAMLEILKRLQSGQTEIKTRLDGIDGRLNGIDGRLDAIEGGQLALLRIVGLQHKTLEEVGVRLGLIEVRLKKLEEPETV